MISTRSVGLLIDTVVCLTLAKWETVSGRFGGYLRVVLRKALARQSSKANQKTRDDNCRAESHPLPPYTSIGVQRGAFKDAAVKSLTSLSVGCWLPLARLEVGLTISNNRLIGWLAEALPPMSHSRRAFPQTALR